ncbi:hypothetical protein DFJ73DRAFT_762022 [Zopfochytrium polystomum]|nr:hypothetical protein DFJ73DRAFT_762022 [Zopfochytrium polystomum]
MLVLLQGARIALAAVAVAVFAAPAALAGGPVYSINNYTDVLGASSRLSEATLYDRHLATLHRIFNNTLAVNKNNIVGTRKLPAGTFTGNATGRITPFGRMKDNDDTIDYLYGMWGNNDAGNTVSLFPPITAYNISAFVSTGAVAHANVEFTTAATSGTTKKIHAQTMFRFDDSSASVSAVWLYDIYFVNVNKYFSEIYGNFDKNAMIGKLCPAIRKVCGNDLSAPYPLLNCEIDLAFKDLGVPAVIADNTILCRAAEVNVAYLRKSVHCPNIATAGGSRCAPYNYTAYFDPLGPSFIDVPSPGEDASVYTMYNEIKKTVFNIYNLTIYPYNLEIVSSGKDTVEYQFGIFGNQNKSNSAASAIPVIHDFAIHAFAVTGTVAATSIDYLMLDTFTNSYYPLRVQGFWRIDPATLSVSAYDVQVQNSVSFMKLVELNIPDALGQAALSTLICASQATACVGANQVYGGAGQPQCLIELGSVKPFGDNDQTEADSVLCRVIHVNLAFLRPEVHCVHVGPTGGGKCVDIPYDDYFTFPFEKPFYGR